MRRPLGTRRSADGRPPCSCGRPRTGRTCGSSIRPTHASCADGDLGEIQVAGPSVAEGYWNRPLETSRHLRRPTDGTSERWLRTGDLGSLRDGELYVTGRIKDLLIVRGAKHFPQDLERTAEPGIPPFGPEAWRPSRWQTACAETASRSWPKSIRANSTTATAIS